MVQRFLKCCCCCCFYAACVGGSGAQIASWLSARALQLDATTGQLTDALQLLELAVDKGYGQFLVQLPCRKSSSGGGSSSAAFSHKPSLSLPQESSISPHHTEAAAAAVECNHIPLHQLLLQGKVLLQLVKSWWPVDEQQQGDNSHRSNSAVDHQGAAAVPGKTELTADMEAAAAATAVAVAATAELQPLWSVTLKQWVSAGLLSQLLAVLNGSSRDLLQRDLQKR